jgi:hypothetical protein
MFLLDRERLSAEVTPRDSLMIMSERDARGPEDYELLGANPAALASSV